MPNLYQKVRPTTQFNQSAVATNAMIDAAKAAKIKPTGISRTNGELPLGINFVLIRNSTGSALPRYSCLSISDPLITPEDNDAAYRLRVMFDGFTPTSDDVGKFAITYQPLDDAQVGLAVINGPAITKIDITDASHKFADVVDGSTTLTSGTTGAASILWQDADTGTAVDCLVILGGGGAAKLPSGLMGQVMMSTTDGSPAQMSYMFTCTPS